MPICFVGSHTSALPKEVLGYDCVDIVLLNEGVYALHNLLRSDLKDDLPSIKGIGYKVPNGPNGPALILNPPERVVPQDRMDEDLPGYAWDLLPFREKPLDMYRAHFWHAGFDHGKRTPFAAIYTSLGCQFACNFCMINIVNRVDNSENIDASHSRGMRFWSPGMGGAGNAQTGGDGRRDAAHQRRNVLPEPEILSADPRELHQRAVWVQYVDLFAHRYGPPERARDLQEGRRQLAGAGGRGGQPGRPPGSLEGSFKEVNIRDICKTISDSDINIISNYIFGFPEDNIETMRETLNLALELNTEMANMYPCQALPGSPLYHTALQNGWDLPDTFEGFAFLSYESAPMRTKYVSAADVLKFRDEAGRPTSRIRLILTSWRSASGRPSAGTSRI